MKNKTIKILTLLAILMIVTGAFIFWLGSRRPSAPAPAPDLTRPAMRLPVDIWPGNFWIIVAEEKGFFEEEGLPVELVDVSLDYFGWIDGLAADKIDMMVMTVFDLVSRNTEGDDLIGVLSPDFSEGGESLLAHEPAQTFDDLRGKRIGVEIDTYLEFFLDIAMLDAGLTESDYVKADYPSDDLIEIYGNKEVDAMMLWEPDVTLAQRESDGNRLFSTSDIPGLAPSVAVLRRGFIHERPGDVDRLLRVWKRASDYIAANPDEALGILLETPFTANDNQPYPRDDFDELLEKDRLATLNDNLRAFSFRTGFDSLYGNAQYAIRFLERKGKINTLPDTNTMLDGSFVRRLQP